MSSQEVMGPLSPAVVFLFSRLLLWEMSAEAIRPFPLPCVVCFNSPFCVLVAVSEEVVGPLLCLFCRLLLRKMSSTETFRLGLYCLFRIPTFVLIAVSEELNGSCPLCVVFTVLPVLKTTPEPVFASCRLGFVQFLQIFWP